MATETIDPRKVLAEGETRLTSWDLYGDNQLHLIGHLTFDEAAKVIAEDWGDEIEPDLGNFPMEHIWVTFDRHHERCQEEPDPEPGWRCLHCYMGVALPYVYSACGEVFMRTAAKDRPGAVAVTIAYRC